MKGIVRRSSLATDVAEQPGSKRLPGLFFFWKQRRIFLTLKLNSFKNDSFVLSQRKE